MQANIHPTAVVEPGAEIDATAEVGPLAFIGGRVRLGPGCRVASHAVVKGDTTIGPRTRIGHHAVLGERPQVRDLEGPPGRLEVGQDNWLRELVTVHAGSPGSVTRLGDGNLLMAYSHVAHDCQLGNGIELANGVQLAGHVRVGDHAGLGGLAAVHQFVRVGELAFVGAGSMVSQDVPPFCLASGDRTRVYGANTVGLRRQGLPPALRRDLALALRLLLGAPTLARGLEQVRRQVAPSVEVSRLLAFAEASERGLCAPVRRRGR
jgi:UDP-N-acetylglucosamine acyltransferase